MSVELELYEDFEIGSYSVELAICIEADAHYEKGRIYGPPEDCYPDSCDLDYRITRIIVYPHVGKDFEIDVNSKDLSPTEKMIIEAAERYAEKEQDNIFESSLRAKESLYCEPDYDPMDQYL